MIVEIELDKKNSRDRKLFAQFFDLPGASEFMNFCLDNNITFRFSDKENYYSFEKQNPKSHVIN